MLGVLLFQAPEIQMLPLSHARFHLGPPMTAHPPGRVAGGCVWRARGGLTAVDVDQQGWRPINCRLRMPLRDILAASPSISFPSAFSSTFPPARACRLGPPSYQLSSDDARSSQPTVAYNRPSPTCRPPARGGPRRRPCPPSHPRRR